MEILLFTCPSCKSLNRLPKKEKYQKAKCGFCGANLLENRPIEIESPEEFVKIIEGVTVPVIVDFWAQWCGPCQIFAPTFRKVATQYPLKANFLKVNIENPQLGGLATQLDIRSIPTIIAFKNRGEVDRLLGALPELQFALWVEQLVEG
ncbi:MAG: thioredoxin TrxC [Campylobacterales bacterium]